MDLDRLQSYVQLQIGQEVGHCLETGQVPVRSSSRSQPSTFFSAEMTVEWFRPPKISADLAVGCSGVLAGQVHGHHPGICQCAGTAVGLQGLGADLEELADGLLDVAQPTACDVWRIVSRSASWRGSGRAACRSAPPGRLRVQGSLQLTDAGAEMLGDVGEHRLGDVDPARCGPGLENRPASRQIGRSSLTTIPPRNGSPARRSAG